MKLYLVMRNDDRMGYDEFDSFVVRAKDEDDARVLCSEAAADEGKEVWLRADVEELRKYRERGIVLGSFNAG